MNICFTDAQEYVPFVKVTSTSFLQLSFIIGISTRVKQRVSLVEQELLTVSEHHTPRFNGVIRVVLCLVCLMHSVL